MNKYERSGDRGHSIIRVICQTISIHLVNTICK
jgi:hypothetical protein